MKTSHKVTLNAYWGSVTIESEKKEDLSAFLTFLSVVLKDASEMELNEGYENTCEEYLKIRKQVRKERDE